MSAIFNWWFGERANAAVVVSGAAPQTEARTECPSVEAQSPLQTHNSKKSVQVQGTPQLIGELEQRLRLRDSVREAKRQCMVELTRRFHSLLE
jgi:acyl transferase domain-containing protein